MYLVVDCVARKSYVVKDLEKTLIAKRNGCYWLQVFSMSNTFFKMDDVDCDEWYQVECYKE
jgi:hypothetical protein